MSGRVELLRIAVTTGADGHEGPVTIRVNGSAHPLNRISGGTGPGETYEGEFFIGGLTRECLLLGSDSAPWAIKALTVELEKDGDEDAHHVFGALTLEPGAHIDILHAPT